MIIIPAIDLIDGKCVRLTKGDYNTKTIFNDDPLKVAKDFIASAATLIHLVDLDGAKAGKIINIDTIKKLCEHNIPIEVGGGIRSFESIDLLLNLGVKRVILGSIAVKDQNFLKEAIDKYGSDKIVLGLDCSGDKVSIHGWQENSSITCMEMLNIFKGFGGKNLIYTDISKDGTMQGPNFDELKNLVATNLNVVASGGVSSLDDIIKCKKAGCYGAIIGKAYYLGKISISEAVKYAN